MGTPQQAVDSYLEPGTYDEWQKLDRRTDDADRQFFQNRVRLHLSASSPLADRLNEDFDVLYKIAGDYAKALKLVVVGRRPNKEKIWQVYGLYDLAVVIVENEVDMLDAMFATCFASAWIVFPFTLLQAQASGMLDALNNLKAELKKAELEASNARAKGAFHLVLACVEAMVPEISLLGRLGIVVGDIIVDRALGPEDPSTTQTVTGIATPTIKQVSEAVHESSRFGHEAHEVAKKTGHVATAATFYFDYKEIGEGDERVEKLTELTETAKRAYDSLLRVLEDNKSKIEQFFASFERWTKAIESMRETTDNCREKLADDMTEAGYSINQSMAWPDAA
jgi:hypothetical protein